MLGLFQQQYHFQSNEFQHYRPTGDISELSYQNSLASSDHRPDNMPNGITHLLFTFSFFLNCRQYLLPRKLEECTCIPQLKNHNPKKINPYYKAILINSFVVVSNLNCAQQALQNFPVSCFIPNFSLKNDLIS